LNRIQRLTYAEKQGVKRSKEWWEGDKRERDNREKRVGGKGGRSI